MCGSTSFHVTGTITCSVSQLRSAFQDRIFHLELKVVPITTPVSEMPPVQPEVLDRYERVHESMQRSATTKFIDKKLSDVCMQLYANITSI